MVSGIFIYIARPCLPSQKIKMKLRLKTIDSFVVAIVCLVLAVVALPPGFRNPVHDYTPSIMLALLFGLAGTGFLISGIFKLLKKDTNS